VAEAPGVPALDDGDLVRLRAGDGARPQAVRGTWEALAGSVPGDVDAFGLRTLAAPGSARSWAFSTLSNEDGFLDGDVLVLADGGGVEVLWPESVIAALLGTPDAPIDLDAVAFDEQDRLLFSLQSDLDGTVVGDVSNGDVLRIELGGALTRLLTEDEVQLALFEATGLTDPVGDVHGLEWVDGAPWVVTQGPSAVDGGVLRCGASPALVLAEEAAGLGGAELDALARVPAGGDVGALTMTPSPAFAGSEVWGTYAGGAPGGVGVLVLSGGAGWLDASGFPGWGAWYLDPADPWLAAQVANAAWPMFLLDASGSGGLPLTVPLFDSGGLGWTGSSGWSFQVLELPSGRLSAPFRLEV
jgi:hypothetical protein